MACMANGVREIGNKKIWSNFQEKKKSLGSDGISFDDLSRAVDDYWSSPTKLPLGVVRFLSWTFLHSAVIRFGFCSLRPPLWNPRYVTDPRLSAVSVRSDVNHTELCVIFSINANEIMRIVLHFTFYIWSAHLRCQCTTWGGAAGAGKVEWRAMHFEIICESQ